MFFVRYDPDGDNEINNTETGRILDDIDNDRLDRAPPTPTMGDITRYIYISNQQRIEYNY